MSSRWVLGLAMFVLGGCGGESASDSATGGSSGAAGSGANSGAGGTSSGGSAGTSGSGGIGGSAGANACTDPAGKICSGPAQCQLVAPSCCLCGMPELSDFVALNTGSASQCACAGPACGCASAENPNLAASCEGGSCAAWDVRQRAELSGCTSDTECRLRLGLDCCEACDGSAWGLVAIRLDADAKIKQAMCTPNEACSKCMVQYPPGASAACLGGHCQVVLPK